MECNKRKSTKNNTILTFFKKKNQPENVSIYILNSY